MDRGLEQPRPRSRSQPLRRRHRLPLAPHLSRHGRNVDFVAGKAALARYWGKALAIAKDLRFHLDRVYVGSDSLTIAYRNHRGQNAAETFRFNDKGLVIESIATYA